jgi:16S rRNA processing protein RimM
VRVRSHADPPQSLLQYRTWRLRRAGGNNDDGNEDYRVLHSQWDGHLMRAQLEGIADRNASEGLTGCDILVDREQLPATAAREYYREDLEGFTVRNCEGVVLGVLQHFLDAPAGALMVVSGDKERWLPTSAPFLRRVDLGLREIEIDWPADF